MVVNLLLFNELGEILKTGDKLQENKNTIQNCRVVISMLWKTNLSPIGGNQY